MWLTQREILATLCEEMVNRGSCCLCACQVPISLQESNKYLLNDYMFIYCLFSSVNENVISPGLSIDGKIMAEILSGDRIFLFYNRGILQYSYYYYCFIIEEYPSNTEMKFQPTFYLSVQISESNSPFIFAIIIIVITC